MNTTKSESVAVGTKLGQHGASKLLYTVFMFFLLLGLAIGIVVLHVRTLSYGPLAIGIPIMLTYSIICFAVKKGSRGWLIWWGILSAALAVWWVILLIRR